MSLTGVTGRGSCSTQDHRQHTPATSLYCLCCVHSVCVSAVQCELHLRVQTHLHNLPYILPSRPPAPLSAPPGPDSRRWAGAGAGSLYSSPPAPCTPPPAPGPPPCCRASAEAATTPPRSSPTLAPPSLPPPSTASHSPIPGAERSARPRQEQAGERRVLDI